MDNEPINLLKAAKRPLLTHTNSSSPTHRIVFYFFIALILFVGAAFTVKFFWSESLHTPESNFTKILQPKKLTFFQTVKNFFFGEEEIALTGHEQDRVNILVLGMGGPGHDGPYLTDTNMIISIKPSTKEVAMISIPRDLGVNIPGYGLRKINQVNSIGEGKNKDAGGEFTREFFSKTFNIDIPYYIRVDFKAFSELIDTVGGVDINVERSFVDNEYPNGEKELGPNCIGQDESSPCRYLKAEFTAGEQHMDGRTALIYSRSRHGGNGEGSDFARAKRQQKVLSALKNKILSAGTYTNPLTISKIISSVSGHVTTNLEIKDMLGFASLAKDVNTSNIKTLVLDTSPNGYLTPVSLAILAPRGGNFTKINTAIKNIFESNNTIAEFVSPTSSTTSLSSVFPNAKIEVQNGTWQIGLAARVKKDLQDKGFAIHSVGNSLKRPVSTTTIYVIHPPSSDEMINTLSKELKAQISVSLPEWLENESFSNSTSTTSFQPDTDILVILGNDIRERFNL